MENNDNGNHLSNGSLSRSRTKLKTLTQSQSQQQHQSQQSQLNNQSIHELQSDNERLNDELKGLTRNFEAICLKLKEDKNLLKRLEDELYYSKNKITKDEMEKTIQAYKTQIDQLTSSLTSLEYKYRNSSQNCAKYQSNELKYKAHINKLESLLQQKDKNESQSLIIKRNKDEETLLLSEDNKRINEENRLLKVKMEEMNKKINETNGIYDKLRKENGMIYNLLEETRTKLKKNQELVEELTIRMRNNPDKKYYKMYEEAVQTIEQLNINIEIKEEEIKYYKNLNMFNDNDNKGLLSKQSKIDNNNNNNIMNEISIELPAVFYYNTNEFNLTLTNNLNKYDAYISNHIAIIESRHINKLTNLQNLIESLTKKYANHMQSIKRKYDLNILKIKETYEGKLSKKKKRKIILKYELNSLHEVLLKCKEKEKNFVDLSEIRALFNQINEIILRLKLTMETFSLNLKCKNCFKEKTKVVQLSCGHSVCCDCLKEIKECFECSKHILLPKEYIENFSYNNILVRYKYAQQQIESDIELVIGTLKNYLSQK